MVKPFTGEGDVVAWLMKVKLVAKLQQVDDVSSFLPLFLEGDALALYLQLSEEQQSDVTVIERKLTEAFTDSAFKAFSKLTRKQWEGEPVDVYVNELKRLGGLAGFTGVGLDRIVRLTFINGFPDRVSCELQQVPDVFKFELSDLITRARVLTSNQEHNLVATVVHSSKSRLQRGTSSQQADSSAVNSFRGACYRCGGPHMARYCGKDKRGIVCFRCNEEGHIASRCPQNQGNEKRVAIAPLATLRN